MTMSSGNVWSDINNGEYRIRRLSCRQQFTSMIFGQLAYRESLRDIVTCLDAHEEKLYHLGFKDKVARNTLASANKKRDWRIYRDLAMILISKARPMKPLSKELIELGVQYLLCICLFITFNNLSTLRLFLEKRWPTVTRLTPSF